VLPEAVSTVVGPVVGPPGIVPFTLAIAVAGSPVTCENCRLNSASPSNTVGSAVTVALGGGTTENVWSK
jgi:hypothetical protein